MATVRPSNRDGGYLFSFVNSEGSKVLFGLETASADYDDKMVVRLHMNHVYEFTVSSMKKNKICSNISFLIIVAFMGS